jgi:hypothetical protein
VRSAGKGPWRIAKRVDMHHLATLSRAGPSRQAAAEVFACCLRIFCALESLEARPVNRTSCLQHARITRHMVSARP